MAAVWWSSLDVFSMGLPELFDVYQQFRLSSPLVASTTTSLSDSKAAKSKGGRQLGQQIPGSSISRHRLLIAIRHAMEAGNSQLGCQAASRDEMDTISWR